MYAYFHAIIAMLMLTCCGGGMKSKEIHIGTDPTWYPLDFGAQTPYVNGFVEELLFEMATAMKVPFIKQTANWDTLFDSLQAGKFEAILTSLAPYNFNLAKYDFTHNFLDLGPVLIVPVGAPFTELSEMNGELVGTVANDPAVLVLQNYPEIIIRNYSSITDLLNALVAGEIEGALLNRIPANSYIRDLYSTSLKVVGKPLTEEGLHLIALKDRHPEIIKQFDKTLSAMKKKKLPSLLKKWNLN